MSKTPRKIPHKVRFSWHFSSSRTVWSFIREALRGPLYSLCSGEGQQSVGRAFLCGELAVGAPGRAWMRGWGEEVFPLSDSHDSNLNQILSALICEVGRNGPPRITGTGSVSPTYPDPQDGPGGKPLSGIPPIIPLLKLPSNLLLICDHSFVMYRQRTEL